MKRLAIACALFGVLFATSAAPREVPFLSGRVVDEAGLLPTATEERVEARLAGLEAATGAQVAVLLVDSLEGEPLEEFSLRVADTWALGRAEIDDGVLLLIALAERRTRIEVGYGLESRLTDLESGRILREILAPRLRSGEFGAGVEGAVDAIAVAVERADQPAPPPEPPPVASTWRRIKFWLLRAGMSLPVVALFGFIALFGAWLPHWAGWLFLLVPLPLFAELSARFFPGWVIGVLAAGWLVGFPLLRYWLFRTDKGRQLRERLKPWLEAQGGVSGGVTTSGSRYRGSSSGSPSRGGFSGGGGRFGGGGASGRW